MKISNKIQNNFYCMFVIIIQIYLVLMNAKKVDKTVFDTVKLLGVSTSYNKLNYQAIGAVTGGTVLYLSVWNIDSENPQNNSVQIGPYPCIVNQEYLTYGQIMCTTTEAYDYNYRQNLDVIVYVEGKQPSVCSKGACKFNYMEGYTSQLKYVYPLATFPDQQVLWYGNYKINNSQQIKKMALQHLNDEQLQFHCNQYQIGKEELDVDINQSYSINANQWQNISCDIPKMIESGLYKLQFQQKWGKQMDYKSLQQVTSDQKKQYQFAIIPQITDLNLNSSGNKGNILKIKGKGFGKDKEVVSVIAGSYPCLIKTMNSNKIQCQIDTDQISSEFSNVSNIRGQGVKCTLYNLKNGYNGEPNAGVNNAQLLKQKIQNSSISGRIVEQKTIGTWEMNPIEEYHGIHLEGYFKAPRTGNYIFKNSADDSSIVLLNQTPNSSSVDDNDIINDRPFYSNFRQYYTPNKEGADSQVIVLQEGEYYWMEAFSYNHGSYGHFTLSVETPEVVDSEITSNFVSQITEIQIEGQRDLQTISIKVWDDERPFGISFYYYDSSLKQVTWNKFTDENNEKSWFDWTDTQIQSEISNKTGGFNPVVVGYDLDVNGQRCTDCTISGREWVVEFQSYRYPEKQNQMPTLTKPVNSQINLIQDQSPQIKGYYHLFVNDQPVVINWNGEQTDKIYYNVSSSNIYEVLKNLLDSWSIEFSTTGVSYTGYTHQFDLKHPNRTLGEVIFEVQSFLTGGKSGTTPQVIVTEIQSASNRPFYEPIPFELSYQKAENPSVKVLVDGILAGVEIDVNNEFIQDSNLTPILTSFNYDTITKILTVDLSSTTATYNNNDVTISFGNIDCTQFNGTTCNLNDDPEAGDHKPVIFIDNLGFANTDAVVAQNIPLQVDSLSQNVGIASGGQQIEINGKGFPIVLLADSNISVKFDGQEAQILSSNGIQLEVIVPAQITSYVSPIIVSVSVNGLVDQSQTFQYMSDSSYPAVTGVDPLFSSPVKKATITIDGRIFGTDESLINVYLLDQVTGQIKYDLILQNVSDNQIIATLSGGRVGIYDLKIKVDGIGYALGQYSFSYQIEINNISPASGSVLGGTLLTIQGVNFGPLFTDNRVYLSSDDDSINDECILKSSSENEITCIVPPKNPQLVGNAKIVVQAKLQEESICNGNCVFTYDNNFNQSIQYQQIENLQLINDQQFSLMGSGFLQSTNNLASILITENISISGTVISDTQIDFNVFGVIAGEYDGILYLGNIGYLGLISFEIPIQINNILPNRNLSRAGDQITIQGSGFSMNSKVLVGNQECQVSDVTYNEIKCITPKDVNNQQNVFVQDGIYNVQYSSYLTFTSSMTPQIIQCTPSSSTFTASSTINFDINNWTLLDQGALTVWLKATNIRQYIYNAFVTQNFGVYTFTFNNVPAGSYFLNVYVENFGFADIYEDYQQIVIELGSLVIPPISTSLNGGGLLTINGDGFDYNDILHNRVNVCGFPCMIDNDIVSVNYDSLQCILPQVTTVYTFEKVNSSFILYDKQNLVFEDQEQNYSELLALMNNPGSIPAYITSSANDQEYLYDWMQLTNDQKLQQPFNEGQNGNECYFQYDLGEYIRSTLFFVQIQCPVLDSVTWTNDNVAFVFQNYKVQGSNDGINWTNLIYQSSFFKGNGISTIIVFGLDAYRYTRFIETGTSNQDPYCQCFPTQISGFYSFKVEQTIESTFDCDTTLNINGQQQLISSSVEYNGTNTPYVDNILPYYGWQLGGTLVTIYGSKFGTTIGNIEVYIDKIACSVQSVSDTEITCITGDKGIDNFVSYIPSLDVYVNGYLALLPLQTRFYYGLEWSKEETWGLETYPSEGDSVYVEQKQTLIVDQSTPILDTVVVEGRILFADEQSMQFNVKNLIIKGGEIIIGTEINNYTQKLTINLYGNKYDKQLPLLGIKGLSCLDCSFNLIGQMKNPVWTLIKQNANIGDTSLITNVYTNWEIGDVLALATTDLQGDHSEKITITNIVHDPSGDTITFTPALKYLHLSEIESYDGQNISLSAEISNLTRNIIIQGENENINDDSDYGGHIYIKGQQSFIRMKYIQLNNMGQAKNQGKYALNILKINKDQCMVQGISIVESNARGIVLQDVQNINIYDNVIYKTYGHGIMLENGQEINNKINSNLIISSQSAYNILNTDITVAGIWVSNPTNTVIYNHVVGSEVYGIQYQLEDSVEFSSNNGFNCPNGMILLENQNNIVHSNHYYGFRINSLQSKTQPCVQLSDYSLEDPFSINESIQATFFNNTAWKNGKSGFLMEKIGNTVFDNFKILDNIQSGFQIHQTNFTQEDVYLSNSIIVGRSQFNAETIQTLQDNKQTAIITPKTNGFSISNIKFYNFETGSFILSVGSQNDNYYLRAQGGKQVNVEGFVYSNTANSNKLRWIGNRNNIVYDIDGSFNGNNAQSYITPYYVHFDKPIEQLECVHEDNVNYDDSVRCTINVRVISIGNLQPKNYFYFQETLKIFNLNDQTKSFNNTQELPEYFSNFNNIYTQNDGRFDYPMVYAEGYNYNLHWNRDLDWTHLQIYPSKKAELTDKTIILRFNYTSQRELFDVFKRQDKEIVSLYEQSYDPNLFFDSNGVPNSSSNSCSLGQFYIDQDIQTISLCINNKGSPNIRDAIDVNGIYCRDTCPVVGFNCSGDKTKRIWSNTTQWDELKLRKRPEDEEYSLGYPQDGDDVLIPCEWSLVLDIPNINVGTLIIDGLLRIDDSILQTKISANNIWIRAGKIVAGTEQFPYNKQLDIELYGNKYGPSVIIDDISRTGTKSLAVTGTLELYGVQPEIKQSRLKNSVQAGQYQIEILENVQDDWKVGDELILGGSKLNGEGFEKVKIQSISENIIQLQEPIKYWHYGAEFQSIGNNLADSYVSVNSNYGQKLDMRTTVGHITRNIRIYGTNEDDFGGHLQVYHWYKQETTDTEIIDIDLRGNLILQGIELFNMGQQNSENAGIHILNTDTDSDVTSQIIGSSIHDCKGICLNIQHAWKLNIMNSIIYNGEQFLLQYLYPKFSIIENNLFVGVINGNLKSRGDPATLIYMYTDYNPSEDQISVKNNIGQSSASLGFAFPTIECSIKNQNAFIQNEVGNCQDVGIIYNFNKNGCYLGGQNNVYHSQEGISVNSAQTTQYGWVLDKNIIAECNIGIVMRSGSKNDYLHENTLQNTYISTLTLFESCPECYGPQLVGNFFKCENSYAIQMLLTSYIGSKCPIVLGALSYKSINNEPVISSQMYIMDTEFQNYRQTYSAEDFPNIQQGVCGNNSVFKTNPNAAESTASHYLTKVRCNNCENDGLFKFDDPNSNWQGFEGGCGNMDCTGLKNILIQDLSGFFLGYQGSVIPNNQAVGDQFTDECQYIESWNGYKCETSDLGILEWESIGEDAKTINSYPVSVQNDKFTNIVNMWREWEWLGDQPQQKRQNSFVSLVQINQYHNITYSGQKSFDLIHKLSHRTQEGESNRFIIIKYFYQNPLNIEVLVGGQQILPFSFSDPQNLEDHASVCGANNYYYQNQTIHFVVTNEPQCQVQVRLVNYVQINLRLEITTEQFFSDDAIASTFMDKVTAFLQIPYDRVRIVGIVDIQRRILENNSDSDSDQQDIIQENSSFDFRIIGDTIGQISNGYQPSQSFQQLQEKADLIQNQIKNNKNSNNFGLGKIGDVSYQIFVAKSAGDADGDHDLFTQQNDDLSEQRQGITAPDYDGQSKYRRINTDQTMSLALGVMFGIIGSIMIGLIIYHMIKKRQLKRDIEVHPIQQNTDDIQVINLQDNELVKNQMEQQQLEVIGEVIGSSEQL